MDSTVSNHCDRRSPRVLLFAQHTAGTSVRSGVQRVVIELAEELLRQASVDFVRWDDLDGQLRLLDRRELLGLFGRQVAPHPACHRVSARFGDLFDREDPPWLIYPEIPSHLENGNEKFARIVSQCREYGIRVATIFYDLIPVREEAYAAGKPSHLRYLAELVRSDLIIPISRFAGDDLLDYYRSDAKLSERAMARLQDVVRPILLGEVDARVAPRSQAAAAEGAVTRRGVTIVMVGTVEPRKQQTRLLRVLNEGRARYPALRDVVVDIFGSLHPASSDELWSQVNENPKIRFHHYAPESAIEAAYRSATFSAFPSLHEGYGLPIVESLRRGVPVLTADFGAMSEVAAGGGCLLVDVRDDEALLQGLRNLVERPDLIESLRAQIRNRVSRTWADYASELLSTIEAARAAAEADRKAFRATVQRWYRGGEGSARAAHGGVEWEMLTLGAGERSDSGESPASATLVRLAGQLGAHGVSASALRGVAEAAAVIVDGPADLEALSRHAAEVGLGVPLPQGWTRRELSDEVVGDRVLEIARERSNVLQCQFVESMYQAASLRSPVAEPPLDALAIVISTYNRGPFVEMNVQWLLDRIAAESLPVRCVVVDNASTDDTAIRLSRFRANPRFSYQCNSANTGMLGNLRVCSAGFFARYVWLTGDDDFIAEGAISRTLDAIGGHPGIGLLIHNFGVYHREGVTSGDSPEMFFRELTPLAPTSVATGVHPVRTIAAQHDNLFTAVYPIVFRADLLAACFNYPFDGVPFSNLVECVPTTKFILETLAESDAFWFREIGIGGNAHNSWSAHRPRWHLVLMPEVFRLARSRGVAPEKVWEWSQIHEKLFEEAAQIAVSRQTDAHLEPADFVAASHFFRRPVAVPDKLRMHAPHHRWIKEAR